MLFNSYLFLFLFLPCVLIFWWSLRLSLRTRLIGLVIASYLFYGWWDYRFVSLLLFSSIVDYHAGQKLYDAPSRGGKRGWLLVSLVTNLGLLVFFKYSGFMAESVNALADWLRMGGAMPVPQLILPVGISFYTFQTMSYTIDIYRGDSRPATSFWHFAAYVSLFPQLVAGPIVRYRDMEDQLRSIATRVPWEYFSKGVFFFVAGLTQKILLADVIASTINPLFADYSALQFFGSWYAMLGYSCQLYFDFSGYSNMAVGLGLMLGFQFPQNFCSPYQAENISDFWRRWHISLSGFLRDYLFIPLGGSRSGKLLTLRNLFLVMFLGGLWHGAGWTFVFWGGYHGLLLMIHALASRYVSLPRLAARGLTFLAVVVGWTLFRSTDMTMCMSLYQSMFGARGWESSLSVVLAEIGGWKSAGILCVLLAAVFQMRNVWEWKFRPTVPMAMALSGLLVVCVLRFDSHSPFLYFQF